jgi:hypothetical protein
MPETHVEVIDEYQGRTGSLSFSQHVLDEALHVPIMRARPVQALTARADLEFVVALCRSWRESIPDRFLGDGLQQRIAA